MNEGIEDRARRAAAAPGDGAAVLGYASALDAADREAAASGVCRPALASPDGPDLEYYRRALTSYAPRLPADPG